jgi:hypothetical protein
MGGRAQPEEGADSPAGLNGGGDDPPMIELPRANRQMVTHFVTEAMPPNATVAQINHEVSMVLMADAMGRAIHVVRGPGQPLDIPRCTRVNSAGQVEDVPYAYDDERGVEGYHCDCENIALVVVNMIAAMDQVEQVKTAPVVTPDQEN